MRPIVFTSLIFAIPLFLLSAAILYFTGNDFTYTLDDPYIHLALAKNIWLGSYGINLDEPSAPSSSVLWPFLLAPFAAAPTVFEFIPLFLNTVCVILTGWVLTKVFYEQGRLIAVVLALCLMLSMNIYGLAFTGMEHSLQILLVAYIAYGLLKPALLSDSRAALLFYLSLILLPLVRYEGLAITMPVLAYQFCCGNRKPSMVSLACIVVALGAFSFYLNSKELGYLPSSVMAKSSHSNGGSIFRNLISNVQKYGFLLVITAVIALAGLRKNILFTLMLATVTGLHFFFGQYGGYGRYEAYYVVFLMIIGLSFLMKAHPKLWAIGFALPLAFYTLAIPTISTPVAASNIHHQQAQMAKIAAMLGGGVAVNDLGLVALRSRNYVLDLWGLGSIEVLKHRQADEGNVDWMSDLMTKKDVQYAMIYDTWFPQKPSNWIKVAELKLLQRTITPASNVVSLYATSSESASRLRHVLERFVAGSASDHVMVVFK